MAVFYKPQSKDKTLKSFEALCTALDIHGRGVDKHEGRIWFVPGVMEQEKFRALVVNQKEQVGTAKLVKLLTVNKERRAVDCPLLEKCGGCPLEHLPLKKALEAKIQGIKKLFSRVLKEDLGEPSFIEESVEDAYRRVCRLSTKTDHGKVYLGFRSAFSQNLVPIDKCKVLEDRMNDILEPLRKFINSLKGKKTIGHVELVSSDGALGILLRLTSNLDPDDEVLCQAFAKDRGILIFVQEPSKHFITQEEVLNERVVAGDPHELYLNVKGYKIIFTPSAFVQINKVINEKLQDRVLEALDLKGEECVLDLFCGLGNFSFPIAKTGASVVGVDIVRSMVEEANLNAQNFGLEKLKFCVADLEDDFEKQMWAKQNYDAVVLDPGRSGAKLACQFLSKLKPKLAVMISCNPLAASRDVAQLVQGGYKIKSWGVFDMFPRTSHVEMMLVLERAS